MDRITGYNPQTYSYGVSAPSTGSVPTSGFSLDGLNLPPQLQRALQSNPQLEAEFERLPPQVQRELVALAQQFFGGGGAVSSPTGASPSGFTDEYQGLGSTGSSGDYGPSLGDGPGGSAPSLTGSAVSSPSGL